MSLTKEILYGSPASVNQLAQSGVTINEIDEYGLTPLIEAAIVGNTEMAKILIRYGADVNFSDLCGRTPLHWATDNQSEEISKLLLENGANPNAYTEWAEPVLAMPLLRRQQTLKRLLSKHGAVLKFAQDYIEGKLLGHRYDLKGDAYVVDHENKFILLDFEGFYLEFSLAIIRDSLMRFKNNFLGKHFKDLFKKINLISRSLAIAGELTKYQQYVTKVDQFHDRINLLTEQEPLIIPCSYHGHAITFVKCGNFFAKCDRGANSKFEGSAVIYQVNNPAALTPAFIKSIIYTHHTDEFMHQGINTILGLEPIMKLPIPSQTTGNCSWANVEATIPMMLFLLLLQESDQPSQLEPIKQTAMDFFEQWREWDQDRALDLCIKGFHRSNKARKASKAGILAAILVQQGDYATSKGLERAEKILAVLSIPEYRFMLDSYIKVYIEKNKTDLGDKLKHMMDLAHFK